MRSNHGIESEARNYSGPILYYTDAVFDHFTNPRNTGELSAAETDGFASAGDLACSDELKLWISLP